MLRSDERTNQEESEIRKICNNPFLRSLDCVFLPISMELAMPASHTTSKTLDTNSKMSMFNFTNN